MAETIAKSASLSDCLSACLSVRLSFIIFIKAFIAVQLEKSIHNITNLQSAANCEMDSQKATEQIRQPLRNPIKTSLNHWQQMLSHI